MVLHSRLIPFPAGQKNLVFRADEMQFISAAAFFKETGVVRHACVGVDRDGPGWAGMAPDWAPWRDVGRTG